MEKPRPRYPARSIENKQVFFQEAQLIQYAVKLGISLKLYANFQTIVSATGHGVNLQLIDPTLNSRILWNISGGSPILQTKLE